MPKLNIDKVSNLNDEDLLTLEKEIAQRDPFYLIEKGLLSIKTKNGQLIPFKLNKSQKRLLDIIKEKRRLKQPVRIWVLKSRQIGFSIFSEAIIYSIVSQLHNRNALIMASEKEKSNNLFEMSKLFHEKLQEKAPHLAPRLKRSNEKKLEFEDTHSQIVIATAENEDAARSFTFQVVHLSELAFFRNYDKIIVALGESVPTAKNVWDTIIIGETTANGMNHFYKEWIKAIEGKTDWIPFFAPWHEHEEYDMELKNGEMCSIEGIVFDKENTREGFLQEELELKKEYNLTDEQLNWRRWKIVNDKKGDITAFKQENPSCWQESFSMSGAMFFDKNGLLSQDKISKTPLTVGDVYEDGMKYVYREMPTGKLQVFFHPHKLDDYIIALDASEGVDKDEAALVVLNKRLNRVDAIAHGQWTPEELAHLGVMVGNYYNNALIAPENKGYGYNVCQLVYKTYGNIYRRKITKAGYAEEKTELGFNTNSVTRPQMLAQLNYEIKVNAIQLISKDLISQCRNFIIKRDKEGNVKRVEAQAGFQDGLVMCMAIACVVRSEHPHIARTGLTEARQRHEVSKRKSRKKMGY